MQAAAQAGPARAGWWRRTFISLEVRNFRLFLIGQFFSNTGTWVQRIAQDWLVLSLTGNPTDVGFTIALQFIPVPLFGAIGGTLADRYPKWKILTVTQTGMSMLAGVLTALALTDAVRVWHVWIIAFVLGTFSSVDMPTRQSFVNDIVGGDRLQNAISLNSAIFQVGALVGPALSGASIELFGAGYSFLINALSYFGPIVALALMDRDELRPTHAAVAHSTESSLRALGRQVVEGWRYTRSHPRIWWLTMLIGTFGIFISSLPTTLAVYANSVFHTGAGGYGILNASVAAGAIIGALLVAVRKNIRARNILLAAAILAVLYTAAGLTHNQILFAVLLAAVGGVTMDLVASSNSAVQLSAADEVRGRVMGIYMLVFLTGGAAGGPTIGYIDGRLGPDGGMLIAGGIAMTATVLIAQRLAAAARREQRAAGRATLRPAPAEPAQYP